MARNFRWGAVLATILTLSAGALAQSNSDQTPFASLQSELEQSADVVLAQAVQRMINAAGHQDQASAGPDSVVSDFEQRYRPLPSLDVSPALRRLNALRPALEPLLEKEGIPPEMLSVVLVESGARMDAVSSKGARGLWQLMPDTARRYGLKVDIAEDERRTLDKSTAAAARYLANLYSQFGSWPLALAAYNAGEQAVQRAIQRARSDDFVRLSSLRLLPEETRNYVPAVLSAMQLLGGSTLTPPARPTKQFGKLYFATQQE